MERSCQSCGGPYAAKRATARFCSERCRKRAQRGHVIAVFPGTAGGTVGTVLVDAVRGELSGAGRLGTALGEVVLMLATRIEAGQDTGSAVAALTREMRASLAEAVKGANAPRSSLASYRDELAARRTGA